MRLTIFLYISLKIITGVLISDIVVTPRILHFIFNYLALQNLTTTDFTEKKITIYWRSITHKSSNVSLNK